LEVPVGPVVIGIGILKDIVKAQVASAGVPTGDYLDQPFDYMIRQLAEKDI
jgi:phycobilisome core component